MPSRNVRNTLSRQWELLRLLPPKAPGISASALRQALEDAGYSVTKRTVERDLQELSAIFPLQCNDHGIPWGWHWMPGEAFGLKGLGLGEALSLVMVEEALPVLLPRHLYRGLEPRFQQARNKLEALADDNTTARWPSKVANVRPELSLQAPETNPQWLEIIQQGLLEERQLSCSYYSVHQDKQRELTLNPLALVQRGLVTYLIATAENYQDPRQYALQRFKAVNLLDNPARGVAEFDLQAYLDSHALQFNPSAPLQLQAWVSDTLARLLRETPLSNDMTLEPCQDGQLLKASVCDSWQLHWWLRQQGANLCVQAPIELRQFMLDSLQATLQRYGEKQ